MSIVSECMLVNLQVGVWKGYRLDKEASRAVTEQNHAQLDAARVNKHLVAKEVLKPIETAASSVRTHFYDKTLPWKDNGDRVLTRKLYMRFIQDHEALVSQFHKTVDHFVDVTYPAARDQAEFRMGALFNIDDYPSAYELRRKFYVHLDMDAVTTSDDFRVDLEEDQLGRIRADMEQALSQRMAKAMTDVWTRLSTTLGHFAAKMGSDEIFRDSTVRNLEEIVDLLPDLNIMNDPQLEDIRMSIKEKLIGYDPKELRTDQLKRELAASDAARIMQDMKSFMGAFGGR